jgi:xanthine dehydrogenase YagS FAD-binding subunit
MVPNGENQYHAILGNKGPAYFVNASSLAPALIAVRAKVRIASASGERELDIEQLYRSPMADTERELTLKANEILTHIFIPPAGGARSATYEVRRRQMLDWPLATASVSLTLKGETVESASIALGHVAPIPWPSREAEQALTNKVVTEEVALEAGDAAVAKATPFNRNTYRVQLARIAVKRAILAAAGKASA